MRSLMSIGPRYSSGPNWHRTGWAQRYLHLGRQVGRRDLRLETGRRRQSKRLFPDSDHQEAAKKYRGTSWTFRI